MTKWLILLTGKFLLISPNMLHHGIDFAKRSEGISNFQMLNHCSMMYAGLRHSYEFKFRPLLLFANLMVT